MNLQEFAEELKEHKVIRYSDSLNERVSPPDRLIEGKASIDRKKIIEINCRIARKPEEMQDVLTGAFERARRLKLKGKAEYSFYWTPDDFQEERVFYGFEQANAKASAFTANPNNMRIGFSKDWHSLDAELDGRKLELEAKGKYRAHFGRLAKEIGAHIATITLSAEDAQRVARKKEKIGKLLTPEKKTFFSPISGSFSERDVIEFSSFAGRIAYWENLAGKPLVDCSPEQQSRVTKFTKYYLFGRDRKAIADLKFLARQMKKIDLGLNCTTSILTDEQAGKLLGKEIDYLARLYAHPSCMIKLGPGSRMNGEQTRRDLLEGLVKEHFGEKSQEILSAFEGDESSFTEFLKVRGYKPVDFADITKEDYKSTIYNWNHDENKDERKERHLLKFFMQSYALSPRTSIEVFKKDYIDSLPKAGDITARVNHGKLVRLGKFHAPEKGRLFSFSIGDSERLREETNHLGIRAYSLKDNDYGYQITMEINANSPAFLPVQEFACEQLGIKFR